MTDRSTGSHSPQQTEVILEILCDTLGAVSTSFIRRYLVAASGAVATLDTTLNGTTPYVPVGTVSTCRSIGVSPALNSTIVRQTGVGVQTIIAGARSITISVLTGIPTVAIGGGAAVSLPAGVNLTWAVDRGGPQGEILSQAFVFTGVAGSDFVVTTTIEL